MVRMLIEQNAAQFLPKTNFSKIMKFCKGGTLCVTLFFHAMFHKKTGEFHLEKNLKNQFLKNINGPSAQEKNM